MPLRLVRVLLLLALPAGILMLSVASSASTSGDSANLWIDASGGSCARQATPAAYSDGTACSSMQAAVQACQPGDVIRMRAGTYPSQDVTAIKTSPGCTIIGDPGTTTGSIALAGAWVAVQNFTVNGSIGASDVGTGLPNHVTYQDVDVNGDVFWDGGDSITWRGGRLHDVSCNCEGHMVIQGYPYPISNVTVDGVQFDHLTRNSACISISCHNEVIRIDDNASNVRIANSTFLNNDPNSATIFVGHKNCTSCGAPSVNEASHLTIENNFFDSSGAAYYTVETPCTHSLLAYNTFLKAPYPTSCDSSIPDNSDLRYVGNLGLHPTSGCAGGSGISFDHNVWIATGSAALTNCGSTDKAVSSGGFASDGFHLTSSSPAVDAGSTTYCPARDHDGDARPQSGAPPCDAGADQLTASSTGGTPTTTTTTPTTTSTTPTTTTTTPTTTTTTPTTTSTTPTTTSTTPTTTTTTPSTTTTSPTTLIGDGTVESQLDSDSAGMAEAFQATAVSSGALATLKVYVDSGSSATTLRAGIYTDANGHPGRLLSTGSLSAPGSGGWRTMALSGASLAAGQKYWIAVLGTGGKLAFRDRRGAGRSETSASRRLTALPATWTTGTVYTDGSLSSFATT